jgi:hypothetical protein
VLQIHSPQQLFGFEILSHNSVNQIRNAAIFLLGKPFKRCSHVRLQANPDRRFFCHAKLSSFPYRQRFDNIVIYCCLAYSLGNCNPWRAEADRYRKARNRRCGLCPDRLGGHPSAHARGRSWSQPAHLSPFVLCTKHITGQRSESQSLSRSYHISMIRKSC